MGAAQSELKKLNEEIENIESIDEAAQSLRLRMRASGLNTDSMDDDDDVIYGINSHLRRLYEEKGKVERQIKKQAS